MSKVRLQGPENCGGFSHDGVSYAADENGVIEVPAGEAVTIAHSHGFKPAEKMTPKPLAKDAGNAKGGDGKKPVKTSEPEDAGNAKGGDGK